MNLVHFLADLLLRADSVVHFSAELSLRAVNLVHFFADLPLKALNCAHLITSVRNYLSDKRSVLTLSLAHARHHDRSNVATCQTVFTQDRGVFTLVVLWSRTVTSGTFKS